MKTVENKHTEIGNLEGRVASLEERMDAVELELQKVPRVRPAGSTDEMADELLREAVKEVHKKLE